jgi:hypothetical protein
MIEVMGNAAKCVHHCRMRDRVAITVKQLRFAQCVSLPSQRYDHANAIGACGNVVPCRRWSCETRVFDRQICLTRFLRESRFGHLTRHLFARQVVRLDRLRRNAEEARPSERRARDEADVEGATARPPGPEKTDNLPGGIHFYMLFVIASDLATVCQRG